MNSSTRRAIASEKTIPAMTARAVITSCMTFLLETCLPKLFCLLPAHGDGCRLSSLDRGQYGGTVSREDASHFFVSFAADFHRIANIHQRRELDHIPVVHANATMRRRLANRTRRACSVNSVALLVESNPPGTKRV